jgi:hypothetical protein
MKERIKEIALQAGGSHYPTVGGKTLQDFADLLIKDCIDNVKVWEKDSRNHISYMLKQHYGIKE